MSEFDELVLLLRADSTSLPSKGEWIERDGDTIPNNSCSQAADAIETLQHRVKELEAQLVCESAEWLEDGEAPADYVRGWNDALSTVSGKPVPLPDGVKPSAQQSAQPYPNK